MLKVPIKIYKFLEPFKSINHLASLSLFPVPLHFCIIIISGVL